MLRKRVVIFVSLCFMWWSSLSPVGLEKFF